MKIIIYRAFNETDCYIGTSAQSIQKIIGLIKEFSRRDKTWAVAKYLRVHGINSLKFEVVCESDRRNMDNDLYETYQRFKPNLNINDRFT